MKKITFMAGLISASSTLVSNADTELAAASEHAPISVMADHLHLDGEWMLSYRYMQMEMSGNLIGSDERSARDIVGTATNPGQFMVAPTDMPMQMHMLGAMYGINDKLTLLAMLNFVSKQMSHITRVGGSFITESSGLGDIKVGLLVGLFDTHFHSLHANINISLPTGATDQRDDTPIMNDAFLPYPMQLGSGTYDFIPGITYRGHSKLHTWSWGAQVLATIRTGSNDEAYALGDRLELNAWLARDVSRNISVSLGLKYQDWSNIDGQNIALNPMMIQTANSDLQAGTRLDFTFGLNYIFNNGHRLAIDYAQDIAQDLDGPQLKTDTVLTIGWQKAF